MQWLITQLLIQSAIFVISPDDAPRWGKQRVGASDVIPEIKLINRLFGVV
jgi:hypothetical protein